MSLNVIQKLILKDHPGYDFDRYSFQAGDVVRTLDGALVVVEYSAIDYVSAYPVVRSMKYRQKEFQRVPYSDLPYYTKGQFESVPLHIRRRKVKWNVGDVVDDGRGVVVLLCDEREKQCFIGYVLQSENDYYLHTRIYLSNPLKEFVLG